MEIRLVIKFLFGAIFVAILLLASLSFFTGDFQLVLDFIRMTILSVVSAIVLIGVLYSLIYSGVFRPLEILLEYILEEGLPKVLWIFNYRELIGILFWILMGAWHIIDPPETFKGIPITPEQGRIGGVLYAGAMIYWIYLRKQYNANKSVEATA